jgi:hypothetical protein
MCDCHSICVRTDGAIAHIPGNSHSGAVEAAKWRENQPNRDAFFVECEWNGRGKFPGADKITRSPINERQRKVIENHYHALEKLIGDPAQHAERMLLKDGIFAGEQYGDIRWRVITDPACPKKVLAKLLKTTVFIDKLPDHPLPAGLTSVGGYLNVEGYNHPLPAGLTHKGIIRK